MADVPQAPTQLVSVPLHLMRHVYEILEQLPAGQVRFLLAELDETINEIESD
jgi:hypothetical protein